MKTYRVNEVFYSVQGEGVRAGTVNTFVRFTGCNLQCSMEPGDKSPGGFDCDTEFTSGRTVTIDELLEWMGVAVETTLGERRRDWVGKERWTILTGGEPGLQVDQELIDALHSVGYKIAVETNGTLPWKPHNGVGAVDWITLSPKVAEHAVKCLWANELKYVRGYGQGVPKPAASADHYLISPAFDAMQVHPKTLGWCTRLCLENPQWRLSLQTHKLLKVR